MYYMQGIVNAIRKLGGRYLVLNEQTGIYTDIGDKKATEKTSQALREGQAQIKKDIRSQEEGGGESKSESSLLPLPSPIQMNVKAGKEMSSENYFRNSLEVLKSLYHVENNMTREMAVRPAPNSVATQLELQSAVSSASAHMTTVRDHFDFDGMVPVQLQQRQQSQQQHLELETRLFPNTSAPLASKMPPRPRSCSTSPDLKQSDKLSLSSWSLSNSSVSGMSFLSLSDTFSTAAEACACAGTITTGADGGGGGDQESRAEAEEGTELMQLIEPEPELTLMHIQVMNIGDSNLMRGSDSSHDHDLGFTEISSINTMAMDVFDEDSLI